MFVIQKTGLRVALALLLAGLIILASGATGWMNAYYLINSTPISSLAIAG